ncbi:O-linked N-acetylglucosamine transferase, SPINDLY family protein [Methylobacterium sp. JK268]
MKRRAAERSVDRASARGANRQAQVYQCLSQGLRLHQKGDTAGAEAQYRRATLLDPSNASAHHLRSLCLRHLGQFDGALAALRKAVSLAPENAEIQLDHAKGLMAAGDLAAAETALRAAAALDPSKFEAPFQLGLCLDRLGRFPEAVEAFEAAIALRPDNAEFHNVLGCLLLKMNRLAGAYAAFARSLTVKPDAVPAMINMGLVCALIRRPDDAVEWFRKALLVDPTSVMARFELLDQLRHACEWSAMREHERRVIAQLETAEDRLSPFKVLTLDVSPAMALTCARRWTAGVTARVTETLPPPPAPVPGRRIRVGYLSSDLHYHATAMLAVGLFEQHDRTAFEVFAYSHGPRDDSPMRRRLLAAFEHFEEIGALSDREAAERIRADGIDILVDLKGYTRDCRTEIMALRPAAVQVNYLGYPGTLGAPFIDYIVGDAVITPTEHQPFYDERIVNLPGCYQPNDVFREIEPGPGRAACGLPDDAVVFCCFNNTYKITAELYDSWMRILARVPDAVLWLFQANGAVQDNLQYEAGARGIDPARIVFAPNLPLEAHLRRLGHADLFLDTLPVNAHTTASDALRAGVPVLTRLGDRMVGRVAASLLHAVGLPELAVTSAAAYEALAIDLGLDRSRLADLRARLDAARRTTSLFDPARYARGLEAAFRRMHALRCAGRPPEPFAVLPADI